MTEHNTTEGLIIHGYVGINNMTNALYLCNGIKSSTLTHVQAMILAKSELRHGSTWCVTLFTDYILQDRLSSTHEVDKMGTDNGNTLRNVKRNRAGKEDSEES